MGFSSIDMVTWRKSVKLVVLSVAAFLLLAASPASLMICQMEMANCPSCCGGGPSYISKNSSVEVTCSKDCCLTVNRSTNPAVPSELKNVFDGKTKGLVLITNQVFSIPQFANFEAFKFHSLKHFHPSGPEVYLLKSSWLI